MSYFLSLRRLQLITVEKRLMFLLWYQQPLVANTLFCLTASVNCWLARCGSARYVLLSVHFLSGPDLIYPYDWMGVESELSVISYLEMYHKTPRRLHGVSSLHNRTNWLDSLQVESHCPHSGHCPARWGNVRCPVHSGLCCRLSLPTCTCMSFHTWQRPMYQNTGHISLKFCVRTNYLRKSVKTNISGTKSKKNKKTNNNKKQQPNQTTKNSSWCMAVGIVTSLHCYKACPTSQVHADWPKPTTPTVTSGCMHEQQIEWKLDSP